MMQGDVLLTSTFDGGDITVENGDILLSGDLRTAVYLSLFGGQSDWWGDLTVADPDFHNGSETAALLDGIPAIPANLRRVEDAARRDLAWLLNKSIASSITVAASMPERDRVNIVVTIEARGEESEFEYTENWQAFASEENDDD